MPEVSNRKESALKTITAQAWKLGTVGLAFVLAFTLLISSTPSKTAEATESQTTTCTIDVSTATRTTTVAVRDNTTDGTLTTVADQSAILPVGTIITNGLTLEQMTVTAVSTTTVTTTRGTNSTTKVAIAITSPISWSAPTAGNGIGTCTATAGKTLSVKIKTTVPNTEVYVTNDEFTAAQAATTINEGGAFTASDVTLTVAASTGITDNDVIRVGAELMLVTDVPSANNFTVTRGHLGTTAAIHADGVAVTETLANVAKWADNNAIEATINGVAGVDSAAEAITKGTIALDTFTAGTASASAYYSGTVSLTSAAAGEGVIAIGNPIYLTDPDSSTNLVHFNFKGAPIGYTDVNVNGKFDAGDTVRSSLVAATTVSSSTSTDDIVFDVVDTKGQELKGTATLTLGADAIAAGVTFANSGMSTISQAVIWGDTTETVSVTGLPLTGNFRYSYTVDFSGTDGALTDINRDSSSGAASANVLFRTNNITSTISADFKKTATVCSTSNACATSTSDSVITNMPALLGNDDEDDYYIAISALDSAGNPVADTIKVKDNDGDGTQGLGDDITLGLQDTTPVDTAATSFSTSAGAYNAAISQINGYSATVGATATGVYKLTFYRSANSAISTDVTVQARSAAKTYTITATSGQNADGSLSTSAVGTWTVTAVDINGNQISGAAATTFVVTGLGTGATSGKSIPTSGTLSVSATTGGVISVVAPTVAGSGTIAVISSTGKIVASSIVSFTGNQSGATVSGAGCNGTGTGSYTCVVTDGGTAAEVATAAGAVSVWQSDADGVLQGYVVGTPDFVNTGLASTAAIDSNSAVIVVR
jgi:hypothetical protein